MVVTGPHREHGGTDAQGAATHDFSTNSNACGPCPGALAAVAAADPTRYPDPGYAQLRAALGALHGVSADRIVVAGSASEFIFRISAWVRQGGARQILLPAHGYGDYAAAATAWGLEAGSDRGAGLWWTCDPSSPLGIADPALRGADLPHEATIVLDRAYEPLRLHGSPPARAIAERCWQLWSPNKALGLTGVRAAYAIAPAGREPQVAELMALAASWPVGAHGVAMLQAWCDAASQDWVAACWPRLRDWKSRQAALCESMGWQVLPSDANYFTCRAPAVLARVAALRRHGVRVRDCASFGLPGHVRLGVLPPASQDALQQAWEAVR